MPQIVSGSEEWPLNGPARITRKSIFTGRIGVMNLPITQTQFEAWKLNGVLIQEAMPQLTPDQREFLMTGATPEEWDAVFPPDDEED